MSSKSPPTSPGRRQPAASRGRRRARSTSQPGRSTSPPSQHRDAPEQLRARFLPQLAAGVTWQDIERAVADLTDAVLQLSRQRQRLQHRRAAARAADRRRAAHRIDDHRDDRRRANTQRQQAQEAMAAQRLYRRDRRKAFRQLQGAVSPRCNISTERLEAHFRHILTPGTFTWEPPPSCFPELPSADGTELTAPLRPQQVKRRLARMANTAPGADGPRYRDWAQADPSCTLLTALFNRLIAEKRIPSKWKESQTLLIHKGGDQEEPSNWRPIALCSTAYKLFTALLNDRLLSWATRSGLLSPQQKGFTPCDGILEHDYTLRAAIESAKRHKKDILVTFLDLANAFGSVPHAYLFEVIRRMGVPAELLALARDIYSGATTRLLCEDGLSGPHQHRRGR